MICPKVAELIMRLADSKTFSSICCCESLVNTLMVVFAHKYPVDNTFDNNNRTIHNQSEVDSPKAHQVARYAKKVHHRNGKKHGKRNNRSHNKSCPHVAQQQYQNKNNNQCSFNKVF